MLMQYLASESHSSKNSHQTQRNKEIKRNFTPDIVIVIFADITITRFSNIVQPCSSVQQNKVDTDLYVLMKWVILLILLPPQTLCMILDGEGGGSFFS